MTDQTIDIDNVNRLLAKFQARLGELQAQNIALENEVERLVAVIKHQQAELESLREPAEAKTEDVKPAKLVSAK